jgi:hypothetical protein
VGDKLQIGPTANHVSLRNRFSAESSYERRRIVPPMQWTLR